MIEHSAHSNRHERGSALLISMLLLVMLVSIGMAALATVARDRQVAGLQSRTRIAFYAAEAAGSEALRTLVATGTPAVAPGTVGDAVVFPHGLPAYGVDTTAVTPIEDLGTGPASGMGLNVGQGGSAVYSVQYWRIRVEGQGPGGTVARIEFVTSSIVGS